LYLELSEEEAHVLILKGLGLESDAQLRKRGELHVLTSPHEIIIRDFGEQGSLFRPPGRPLTPHQGKCGPNCNCPEKKVAEIPDDCFVVDPDDATIAELEENLDGT